MAQSIHARDHPPEPTITRQHTKEASVNENDYGAEHDHDQRDTPEATGDSGAGQAPDAPIYESQPLPDDLAASATQPSAEQNVHEETSARASEARASGSTEAPTGEPAFERTGRSPGARRIEIGVVQGDLTITGGASEVVITSDDWDEDEPVATERAGVIRLARISGDAEVSVPDDSEVYVREVQGDLTAHALDGLIQIARAQGDADARDVAVVILARVDGDLSASNIGDLSARTVDGDVSLDTMSSAAAFQRIGGDLEARDIVGVEVSGPVGGGIEIDRCEYIAIQGPIGGDAEIARCAGPLALTIVGGDLNVEGVAALRVSKVGGDLKLQAIAGETLCEVIGGDATLHDIRGAVRLGVVGGDLEARRVSGGVVITQVGGDAQIDTALGPQTVYQVTAGGDIALRLRGEINARFVAQSGGEIRTRLPFTVERGRRRHLVGALGDGSATVTLHAGGDISINGGDSGSFDDDFADFGSRFGSGIAESFANVASGFADMFTDTFAGSGRQKRGSTMSDENNNPTNGPEGQPGDGGNARTWEGNIGQHKFRMRVEREPGRAGFQFKGPYTEEEAANGEGEREFNVQWERGRGASASGEYEQRLNEMRDRAEKVARRAAEEAKKYADMAAKRARETDWEAMGREVRSTIERAMSDLEDAFGRVRRDWEQPRSGGSGSSGSGSGNAGGAQRVRIEQDEAGDVFGGAGASASGSAFGGATQSADRETQRRDILEQLRSGAISLDEAERRLNGLR